MWKLRVPDEIPFRQDRVDFSVDVTGWTCTLGEGGGTGMVDCKYEVVAISYH